MGFGLPGFSNSALVINASYFVVGMGDLDK